MLHMKNSWAEFMTITNNINHASMHIQVCIEKYHDLAHRQEMHEEYLQHLCNLWSMKKTTKKTTKKTNKKHERWFLGRAFSHFVGAKVKFFEHKNMTILQSWVILTHRTFSQALMRLT